MLSVERPFKVLLSAYACAPHRGSEPAVGWNLALGMARHHEVWVLTRARNRAAIERELALHAGPVPHFSYVELPDAVQALKRGRLGLALYYDLWQLAGQRAARALHARVQFDLAQHVTFVKYTAPSLLAGLRLPFIWGPVGGGEAMPRAFVGALRWRGRLHEAARSLARSVGERDPRVRATARRCDLALATSEQTARRLRSLGARDVRVLSQVGIRGDEITAQPLDRARQRPFRLISVGRLLHWKGFDLGLRAFAAARASEAEYWIVGAGPERQALEALAQRLGVRSRVQFTGELPQPQVLELLRRSHLLVHPSLHDSGGAVCGEALAAGCPVACLALGGPGLQVHAGNGFPIPARHPEQVVAELAEVFVKLAGDPELLSRKSLEARRAARERSWERKCEELSALYRLVLTRCKEAERDERVARQQR